MVLPSQPILGLIDGMEVLQLLASVSRPMSGVEISKELNIEKTKVNRILKTLAFLGFTMPSTNRKYTLGPAIHVLSAQLLHGSGLIKNALKYLIELTELNVVVAMGVLWRDKVTYTYHWLPGLAPTEGLGSMDLFPATQSSIGLALLAEKTDEEITRIINLDGMIPGQNSKEEFFSAIDFVRKEGYAKAMFENHQSIGIRLGSPGYAALALAHIENKRPMGEYLEILKQKAALIEAAGPVYK
jgi:DNA-binding IclR family transcriptional regulator